MALDKLVEELDNTTTRRSVIQTGAKLAYAAPVVAASFKLSAAAAGAVNPGNPNPECKGASCGNFYPCSNANPDCVCVTTRQGGLCVPGSTACAGLLDCTNAACPEGSLCAVNTCCDTPVCVPLTLECAGVVTEGNKANRAERTRRAGTIGG